MEQEEFESKIEKAEITKIKSNPETLAARKKLYASLFQACKEEKTPVNGLAYMVGVNANTVQSMRKNRDMALYSFLRLADALGYEVMLAKKSEVKKWNERPELMSRLVRFKQKQLYAKRKQRNQPTEGFLPVRERVKLPKSIKTIISRRSLAELQRKQDDIRNSIGGHDAVQGGDMA